MKVRMIEPFVRYPESIIDSETKALQVIRDNSYYIILAGIVLLSADIVSSFYQATGKRTV